MDEFSTLTEEERIALSGVAEEVQTQAKKSFSLSDRLQGTKLATTKVLVFLDLDAVTAWQQQEAETTNLAAALQVADEDEKPQALADYTAAEDMIEPLRARAFQDALAIHMRAVPQVALEAAQRKARNEFKDDTGQVPEEKRQEFFERQNEILLGQCVTRIVDATGAEAEFTKAGVMGMLRGALPNPQFTRVISAFNTLMFNDSLGRAATADPGF